MTTTTKGVPVYFPDRKRKKRKGDKSMKEAKRAADLVEAGLAPLDALELVLEVDDSKGEKEYESAAKKMAARIKDPDKRKAAEKKFAAAMFKRSKKKDKE